MGFGIGRAPCLWGLLHRHDIVTFKRGVIPRFMGEGTFLDDQVLTAAAPERSMRPPPRIQRYQKAADFRNEVQPCATFRGR
jgi:hypothetical protein